MLSKELHRILRELDVGAALKKVADEGGPISDDTELALVALHKSRIIMGNECNNASVSSSRE